MITERSRIRVAFMPGERVGWTGGLNYDRNLLGAIAADPASNLEPLLLGAPDLKASLPSGMPPVRLVSSQMLQRPKPAWAARAIARRLLSRDLLLERILRTEGVAALSHSSHVWRSPTVAMLGWIPDFQHRQLPEFFSKRERQRRDGIFRRICSRSTLVIVSSEACRKDLAEFAPEASERARVLRFVAEPPALETLSSPGDLATRYGLSGPYFHLPGQFWAHKNHALVVEALGVLRDRGEHPMVIATGETRDYRRPGHLASLVKRAQELGVADSFRPLGLIPYADVAGLMRDSVAVLNPSLCEGWSTTVEEAKSLGKRVLLSRIEVHLEQDPPGSVFFDTDDPEDLADAISHRLTQPETQADRGIQDGARRDLAARRLEFARTYEQIVRQAVEIVSS